MKNGNQKTQKTKKPKYSIKDYQDGQENFDAKTTELIEATIAVLNAIDKQENLLKTRFC